MPPLVVKPSGVTEPLDVAKFGRGWSGGAVADNTIEVTAIDMLGLPSSRARQLARMSWVREGL